MKVIEKKDIDSPLVTPTGEVIFELIGRGEEAGGITSHSLAQIMIPPGKSSAPHYHQESEELYYILKGEGLMKIDQQQFRLKSGQTCLIKPGEIHQIINERNEDLEFLAVCIPAWKPEDSFEVD